MSVGFLGPCDGPARPGPPDTDLWRWGVSCWAERLPPSCAGALRGQEGWGHAVGDAWPGFWGQRQRDDYYLYQYMLRVVCVCVRARTPVCTCGCLINGISLFLLYLFFFFFLNDRSLCLKKCCNSLSFYYQVALSPIPRDTSKVHSWLKLLGAFKQRRESIH